MTARLRSMDHGVQDTGISVFQVVYPSWLLMLSNITAHRLVYRILEVCGACIAFFRTYLLLFRSFLDACGSYKTHMVPMAAYNHLHEDVCYLRAIFIHKLT